MLTNANITVYNAKKIDGETVYLSTQIRGVNVAGIDAITLAGKNVEDDGRYTIRIPKLADTGNKQYVDPATYKCLPASDADNYWTLQKGDMLVKGLIDDDIASPGALTKLYGDRALKVMGVVDNRRLSDMASHLRVDARV